MLQSKFSFIQVFLPGFAQFAPLEFAVMHVGLSKHQRQPKNTYRKSPTLSRMRSSSPSLGAASEVMANASNETPRAKVRSLWCAGAETNEWVKLYAAARYVSLCLVIINENRGCRVSLSQAPRIQGSRGLVLALHKHEGIN